MSQNPNNNQTSPYPTWVQWWLPELIIYLMTATIEGKSIVVNAVVNVMVVASYQGSETINYHEFVWPHISITTMMWGIIKKYLWALSRVIFPMAALAYWPKSMQIIVVGWNRVSWSFMHMLFCFYYWIFCIGIKYNKYNSVDQQNMMLVEKYWGA